MGMATVPPLVTGSRYQFCFQLRKGNCEVSSVGKFLDQKIIDKHLKSSWNKSEAETKKLFLRTKKILTNCNLARGRKWFQIFIDSSFS